MRAIKEVKLGVCMLSILVSMGMLLFARGASEEENAPTTWANGWHANGATLVWGYVEELPEEETYDPDDKAMNK